MSKLPLVVVRWNDAHGNATVAYGLHELPHKPLQMTSHGYLLRDDAGGVSIASEYCGDETYRGYTFVPRELVVEVKQIGRRRGKKRSVREVDSGDPATS